MVFFIFCYIRGQSLYIQEAGRKLVRKWIPLSRNIGFNAFTLVGVCCVQSLCQARVHGYLYGGMSGCLRTIPEGNVKVMTQR